MFSTRWDHNMQEIDVCTHSTVQDGKALWKALWDHNMQAIDVCTRSTVQDGKALWKALWDHNTQAIDVLRRNGATLHKYIASEDFPGLHELAQEASKHHLVAEVIGCGGARWLGKVNSDKKKPIEIATSCKNWAFIDAVAKLTKETSKGEYNYGHAVLIAVKEEVEPSIIVTLLRAGAHGRHYVNSENSAFHVAVLKNRPDIIKLLRQYNVNLTVVNKDNKTALDLAVAENKLECIDVLSIPQQELNTFLTESEISELVVPINVLLADNNEMAALSWCQQQQNLSPQMRYKLAVKLISEVDNSSSSSNSSSHNETNYNTLAFKIVLRLLAKDPVDIAPNLLATAQSKFLDPAQYPRLTHVLWVTSALLKKLIETELRLAKGTLKRTYLNVIDSRLNFPDYIQKALALKFIRQKLTIGDRSVVILDEGVCDFPSMAIYPPQTEIDLDNQVHVLHVSILSLKYKLSMLKGDYLQFFKMQSGRDLVAAIYNIELIGLNKQLVCESLVVKQFLDKDPRNLLSEMVFFMLHKALLEITQNGTWDYVQRHFCNVVQEQLDTLNLELLKTKMQQIDADSNNPLQRSNPLSIFASNPDKHPLIQYLRILNEITQDTLERRLPEYIQFLQDRYYESGLSAKERNLIQALLPSHMLKSSQSSTLSSASYGGL